VTTLASHITSTQAALADLLIYCAETGHFFWRERPAHLFRSQQAFAAWNTRFAGKQTFNATDGSGYRTAGIFGRTYRAHTIAWAMVHGVWANEIDHIDGDRTNNRIDNLRSVTRQENQRNRRISHRNTSGVVGVYFNQQCGKWAAQIKVDGRTSYLGLFERFDDAVTKRKQSEVLLGFHPNHGRKIS